MHKFSEPNTGSLKTKERSICTSADNLSYYKAECWCEFGAVLYQEMLEPLETITTAALCHLQFFPIYIDDYVASFQTGTVTVHCKSATVVQVRGNNHPLVRTQGISVKSYSAGEVLLLMRSISLIILQLGLHAAPENSLCMFC